MLKMFKILFIFLLKASIDVKAQFRNYTDQYKELMSQNKQELLEELKSLPDTNFYFYPSREFAFTDGYYFDFPNTDDFRIGIIVDPCKYNSYNCCINTFGTPEYGSLKRNGLEEGRVFKWHVLANDTDIQANVNLVYEDGSSVDITASRNPDDESYLDFECDSVNKPYSRCLGKNYAQRRSPLRQACIDNNQTVNAIKGCYNSDGKFSNNCVTVAYTSNTFVPQCSPDADQDHCGTFLEIHQLQGSPYQLETTKISEVKIETLNISGYYTTVLPLNWMGDLNTTLCSYTESFIRIGSIVYIKEGAVPVCCCPKPFKPATRVGSFQCPLGSTGNGAFAPFYKTLQDVLVVEPVMLKYPFCPSGLEDEDRMWCSVYDKDNMRHFTRECSPIYQRDSSKIRSWTSADLDGIEYDGKCPYYESCTLTLDAGKCKYEDLRFTFEGYVGRVVNYDTSQNPPIVSVTFNDGRTSYDFEEGMVKLERKSMYEIWWVLRTKNQFIVQKRKGFNVTNPACTYDTTNDRYYPYAKLLNGIPQD